MPEPGWGRGSEHRCSVLSTQTAGCPPSAPPYQRNNNMVLTCFDRRSPLCSLSLQPPLTFWLSFSLCLQPLPLSHSTLGARLSCAWMSGPPKRSFMAGFYTNEKTGSWWQRANSSLILCSWTLNRYGVHAEAWRGLRLLGKAGVSEPLRTVSSPKDGLWAFQRELDGGRASGP